MPVIHGLRDTNAGIIPRPISPKKYPVNFISLAHSLVVSLEFWESAEKGYFLGEGFTPDEIYGQAITTVLYMHDRRAFSSHVMQSE